MSLINIFKNNKSKEVPVYVYEWKTFPTSLIPSIFKNSIRIQAKIRQDNSAILRRLKYDEGYFLFHINLTKTAFFFKNKEELLIRLASKNITPLNAQVHDTSKRYLHQICEQRGLNITSASAEGDDKELLIIKTNFNYGGRPEKRLSGADFRRLHLGTGNYDTEVIYPVMERGKINNEVWNNENLVVEKYINNTKNFIYRVYKMLNKVVITEVMEDSVIKKMITATQRINYYYDLNNFETLPGEDSKFNDLITDIKKLSKALNIDFAAIDVVKSDENKYYIIDVNLTPDWNRDDQPEKLKFLAEGLYHN